DRVASRQRLNQRRCELFPFVDLVADDQPPSGEPCDVVRDPAVAAALEEGLEVGRAGVVAKYRLQRLQEGRFAGCGGPLREEQLLLARVTGERVARRALQERCQLMIAAGDSLQELSQSCERAVGSYVTGESFVIRCSGVCACSSPVLRSRVPLATVRR